MTSSNKLDKQNVTEIQCRCQETLPALFLSCLLLFATMKSEQTNTNTG